MNETFKIIRDRATAYVTNRSREDLANEAIEAIKTGQSIALRFGSSVVTISKTEIPVIHLYSKDSVYSLLGFAKRFHAHVWDYVDTDIITAPIRVRKLQKVAKRFGWKDTGNVTPLGCPIFILERIGHEPRRR